MSTSGAHILIFPFPAQGHMLPLLDLTHQLSLRGLTITILITPKNLPILTPLLSTHPQIQTLIFPFPPHPSVPAGAENVKDIGNQGNVPIITALSKLKDPIIEWFQSHPSPPVAILSDFFLGWTERLASQLNIPRIVFYSSGAFLASVLNYLFSNVLALKGLDVIPMPLPNSPSFPLAHLPSIFRRYDESNPSLRFVKEDALANISSYGSVFNSFESLESRYLDHMKKECGHERVWSVGPLALMSHESSAPVERGGPNSACSADVFSWLDGCPDGSVVYVCFGSQVTLTNKQMEALTIGLEESGVRFILIVRSVPSEQNGKEHGIMPTGFEDRTAGRGLVIRGWAPQVPILNHRAVGGFLSHCGWNSVLEAITAGVSLFCWPMEADQFVNAKLLVEDMGVGVVVCGGVDAIPDSVVLARAISELMDGNGGQKVKAIELKEKALDAVKKGGSSAKNLDDLVEQFSTLQLRRSVKEI